MLSSAEQCVVLDKLEGSRDILLGQRRNTGKVNEGRRNNILFLLLGGSATNTTDTEPVPQGR